MPLNWIAANGRFEVPIDITLTNPPDATAIPYTPPTAMMTQHPALPSMLPPNPQITLPPSNSTTNTSAEFDDSDEEPLTGAQIGGIVGGGMAGLLLITCILAYAYLRAHRQQHPRTLLQDPAPGELLTQGMVYKRGVYQSNEGKGVSRESVFEMTSVNSRDDRWTSGGTLRYD
jgi:hypothetical protein